MGIAVPAMALALAGTAAVAQRPSKQPAAEPLRIVLPIIESGCPSPKPGDDTIVVCGREDRRYRIDPVVLAVTRARDAKEGPPRPDGRMSLFQEKCNPVGPAGCSGQGTLPMSNIAITIATALIKVAKGEDVRPMLRTTPSEYEMYKQVKAAEDAKKPQEAPASK